MQLTPNQVRRLAALQRAFEKLVASATVVPLKLAPMKRRRRGASLVEFQKQIAADRKAGLSAVSLAAKYGVTPSYIYQQQARARRAKTGQ